MSTTSQPIDEAKLNEFMGRFVGDLGATLSAALVVIGDKLGLYREMGDGEPVTADELASRTGTDPRYVREWLSNQAAGGYVSYDPASGRFFLTAEQSFALAQEGSPAFIPGYAAHLVAEWIPALDGVQAKLEAGARVADVGCGHGASTILMGEAFPNSKFTGFDYHQESIEEARRRAAAAGVEDRVSFEVGQAKAYPGDGYDLVAMFDCLHDMGDPAGAAAHVLETLAPDGTWMIVEPFAGDRLEDNVNPVGRVFYGASTLVCTPASRAQEVELALGAQAGEERLRDVVIAGGFTRVRRAAETPFNMVLEVRP